MWKLVTGEPYAGKSHVRFGGRGGAEPSLPLSGPPLPSPFPLGYPPTASRRSRWCFLGRRPCGRLQPSATRRSQASPLPARRVQGGAPGPFGCKAVIRSDPGSGAFWGDAHAGASSRVQLGAPGPPLPSPFPLGYPPTASRRSRWCFLGDAHAGVSSRVQLGAPRPPPYLPAECNSALPGLPFTCPPSATRRSQSSPLPSRRVQGGAPSPPYLPADCKSALPGLLVVVHFAAAEVFVGVRVGYEEAFVISREVERGGGGAEGVFAYPG